MSAKRGQTFVVMAVVLGGAAAVLGYFTLSTMANQASKAGSRDLRPVVVTASDLTFGQKLEPTMLRVVKYPKESVPMGAFSTVDSVVGQTTKVFLGAKEPVTAIKLSSRGGGLSMLVRPSMRAASVEVNQVSGVSGFVLPGDRVDVLVTVDSHQMNEQAVTHVILQNIEVLAAGQKTQQQDNKPITVQAVTLLVAPEGAESLAHAMHEGEITLALRNPEDQEQTNVAALNTSEMLGTPRSAPTARVASARRSSSRPAAVPAVMSAPARPKEDPKIRIIRSAKVDEIPAVHDSAISQ